jgi:lysozyme family protein
MSEHVVPWEETFAAGLEFIRIAEGGLSDRPRHDDPGGLTNLGVTQGTLSAYRRKFPDDLDMPSSVRTLQRGQAERIFRRLYWEQCRCAELPSAIALIVFNAAVQSGPQRAAWWLQHALREVADKTIEADGIIGDKTIAAVCAADPAALIVEVLTNQVLAESDMANWNANRRGWARRLFRMCWVAALGDAAANKKPFTVRVREETRHA